MNKESITCHLAKKTGIREDLLKWGVLKKSDRYFPVLLVSGTSNGYVDVAAEELMFASEQQLIPAVLEQGLVVSLDRKIKVLL